MASSVPTRLREGWRAWQAFRADAREEGGLEPRYRRWGTWAVEKHYRPTYVDFDKLPLSGPAILISNHVSYLDGVILSAGCPRPMRFVIDEDIYNVPGVHHFLKHNRAIPVKPTKESVTQMIVAVEAALAEGDLVCIFPEGQLTYTGSLSRFRPGIEWIVGRAQVPVYPMALKGLWGSAFSRKYRGSWKRWIIPHREPIRAICGDPIQPGDVTAKRLQQEVLRLKYRLE